MGASSERRIIKETNSMVGISYLRMESDKRKEK